MKIHQETESPWSTPTESEIGAAERSALSKERDKAFSELGLKVKESLNPKLKHKRKIVKHNMKDVPPSPKKRLPKQNSVVQKHISQHNEDKVICDAGSNKEFAWDKPITDITIPNVIPAPSSTMAVSKLEKCNIEGDDLQTFDKTCAQQLQDDNNDTECTNVKNEDNKTHVGQSSLKEPQGDRDKPPNKRNQDKKLDSRNIQVKRSRSISPAKRVSRPKNKPSSSPDREGSNILERSGSVSSRASGDSLKLGADYTNINDAVKEEHKNDEKSFITKRNDNSIKKKDQSLKRNASPNKTKNKNNSTLIPKTKSRPHNDSPVTSLPSGSSSSTKSNVDQWSSEVNELAKWQQMSNLSQLTSPTIDANKIAGQKDKIMKNVNIENHINGQTSSDQSEKENESPKKQRTINNLKSPSKGSPKKFLPKSPSKSPSKSPTKKLKDVLELPFPYDEITSGKLRYWESNSADGHAVDNEKYPEYEKIRQETSPVLYGCIFHRIFILFLYLYFKIITSAFFSYLFYEVIEDT